MIKVLPLQIVKLTLLIVGEQNPLHKITIYAFKKQLINFSKKYFNSLAVIQ